MRRNSPWQNPAGWQLPQNTDRQQDRVIREAWGLRAEFIEADEAGDIIAALLDVIYDLDMRLTQVRKRARDR